MDGLQTAGRYAGDELKWARIFSVSRPDYVHLRVFSWAREEERAGRLFTFKSNMEGARDRMRKALADYFGEEAGSRIAEEMEKAAAEGDASAMGRQASRHVRNLAYEHSLLCRTDGRKSLDERLDMELAVLEWCHLVSDGGIAMDRGSVLSDDWLGCDGLIARLSPELKEAAAPELAKLRRALPPANPDAEPDSIDAGDIYDTETAVAGAVLSFLTEDEEGMRAAHEDAAERLAVMDLFSVQETLRRAIDRMQGPSPLSNWNPLDVASGADWDLLHSDSRPKRLAAALELVVGEAGTGHGKPQAQDRIGTLCAQFREIDSIYAGKERSAGCQMTRLFAVLRMAAGVRMSEAIDGLRRKGYLDGSDAGWLEGMARVAGTRYGSGWKDADVEAFRMAAGGPDVVDSVLAFQLSDDIASGRGDGYAAGCRELSERISRMADGKEQEKERKRIMQPRSAGGRDGR